MTAWARMMAAGLLFANGTLVLGGNNEVSPDNCSPSPESVEQYLHTSTALSTCLVQNTVPARFCQMCYEQYSNFQDFFSHNISTDCQQYSAYKSLHDSYFDIWTSNNCDGCTVATMNQMQSYLTQLYNCTNDPAVELNSTCVQCKTHFNEIVDFYQHSLSDGCKHTHDNLDAYRRALSVWSSLHCSKPHATQEAAEATLGTLLALVVAFYLGCFALGKKTKADDVSVPRTSSITFSDEPASSPIRPISGISDIPQFASSISSNSTPPVNGRPRSQTTPSLMSDVDLSSLGSNSKFALKYESFSKQPFTPEKSDN